MINGFDQLATQLGIDILELKYVFALFAVLPLAYIHRKMTSVFWKHVYSIVGGVSLAFFMFGWDALHSFISTTICYLIMKYLPHKQSPWLVFFFMIAHLSYGHLYRQLYHYLEFGFDWSLPQMIIVVKMGSMAWAYHDGQLPVESLDREQRKQKRIVTLPSLLEFYSFVYFFAGFLTGPFTEYNHYIEFTNRKVFKDNGYQIPSSWRATGIKFLITFIAYLMNQTQKYYPDMETTTDRFLERSFWDRILFIVISCELGTSKYYVAFSMGQASCNVAGITYNGKDDKGVAKWDRITMARLWEFKTTTSTKGLVAHWNVPCQIWLKDYVFIRIIALINNRILAIFGTFFTSAFWHGFYGGYYCFFLSAAFFSVCADILTVNMSPFFYDDDNRPKSAAHDAVFRFFGWLFTFVTITYITIAFRVLSFDLAMKAWRSIYFSWHICGLAMIVFFTLFPQRRRTKNVSRQKKIE